MSRDYVLSSLVKAGVIPDKIRKSSKDKGLFIYFNTDLENFKRVYFIGQNETEEDLQDTIQLIQGESA